MTRYDDFLRILRAKQWELIDVRVPMGPEIREVGTGLCPLVAAAGLGNVSMFGVAGEMLGIDRDSILHISLASDNRHMNGPMSEVLAVWRRDLLEACGLETS